MDLGLDGAAAIVTGASQGLGRAIAIGLAREGADLVICARSRDRIEAVAAEIRGTGRRCVAVAVDLMADGAPEELVRLGLSEFGRVNVLVNNLSGAVDSTPTSIEQATDRQLSARLEGKTMVALRCSRAVLPAMRAAGWGRIVCMGGTSARTVFRPGDAPMSGSGLPQALGNASVATFCKYLSEEVAAQDILVNVVHPHITKTDRHAARVEWLAECRGVSLEQADELIAAQNPIGRVLEPSDVVPIVLFLSSPRTGAITGQAIAVDGGALRGVNY